ncbi:MAG: glycosyltransferase family 2 protein [Patescibacteria group bacterium]
MKQDKWGEKNKYYHQDIKKFLKFSVPKDASVLKIDCSKGKIPVKKLKISKKYDYIIALDLIGFSTDIQKTFQQIYKMTHSKSRIILTYHSYLWEPILKIAEQLKLKRPQSFQNWLVSSDIQNLLYLAGFEIIKKGERLLIPKYIPLISTLFNQYFAKLPLLRSLCLTRYFIVRPYSKRKLLEKPSVSIVIAARNEKGNIESAVQRIPEIGSHTEIIFVEGGSTDDTFEEIKRIQQKYSKKDIKVFKQSGKGKGDAIRKGFSKAKGDILMILDADLTVKPEELPKFYKAIVSGSGDFINGCRLIYPLEKESMRFLNILGNKFFSLMFSWLLDQRIKDTLCGTKVLWKEDYQRIKEGRNFFGNFDPFGDFDLIFGAAKLNLKIIDLPIRYQERTYGSTNISRFSNGWLLLKMSVFAAKKIKFI